MSRISRIIVMVMLVDLDGQPMDIRMVPLKYFCVFAALALYDWVVG